MTEVQELVTVLGSNRQRYKSWSGCLDQKVSGVILFAKTRETQSFLTENWYDFQKTYHAAVQGRPETDTGKIESWLSEDQNYKVHSGSERPDSKLAITFYEVEKKFRHFSLL